MPKGGQRNEGPKALGASPAITGSIWKKMIPYRQEVLAGLDAYAANAASGEFDLEALETQENRRK